jgi:hypothetical protein
VFLPHSQLSLLSFLDSSYVLAVVGACACLARWIAVQVRFFLSSHLFAMIIDLNLQALGKPFTLRLFPRLRLGSLYSLFIGWLSVTTEALIVESSSWYVSPPCVVLSYMWPTTLTPRPWMRGLVAYVCSIFSSSSGSITKGFGAHLGLDSWIRRICYRSFRRRTLSSSLYCISFFNRMPASPRAKILYINPMLVTALTKGHCNGNQHGPHE